MSFSRSLSFLDLITCGFGAVLLLFLVMLVTVDSLRIRENSNPEPSPSPKQNENRSTADAPENKSVPFLAWVNFYDLSGKDSSSKRSEVLIKYRRVTKNGSEVPTDDDVKHGNDFLRVYWTPEEKIVPTDTIVVEVDILSDRLRARIVTVTDGQMRTWTKFLRKKKEEELVLSFPVREASR